MIRKKIIIITPIVLVMLIIVAAYFIIDKSKQPVNAPLEIKNEQQDEKLDKQSRLIGLPDVVNDDKCAALPEGSQKEDCYTRLKYNAIAGVAGNKNIKACLEFSDLIYRNDCLFTLAVKDKNVLHCERIADYRIKENCIGSVAIESRDTDVCDVFKQEPYEYQECIDRVFAFVAGDIEGSVGSTGQMEIDIESCSKVKTLEYAKLCIGNVQKSGKTFSEFDEGLEENKAIVDAYNNFMLYRTSLTEEECQRISLQGARDACVSKAKGDGNKYADFDGDGLIDDRELWFSTDPGKVDTDEDGLNDYQEMMVYHTNPAVKDTDSDGMEDNDEVNEKTDPNIVDTDNDGTPDGKDDDPMTGDSDKDGLEDKYEKLFGTDPNKYDTDGDGVSDGTEILKNITNPLGSGFSQDTDKDGLIDIDEIFYRTNGLKPDSDGDGVSDGEEVKNLTNPLGAGDMDFDEDGLSDKDEERFGTNPSLRDTNDDGVNDSEAIEKSMDATGSDTDKDGLNNYSEINKFGTDPLKSDTDGDGLIDGDEVQKHKTDPLKADTDGDGYSDGDELRAGYNPRGEG